MVSTSHWTTLPDDVRRILEEEARSVQAFVHETAARLDEELLAQVEAEGVKVARPDRDAFLLASKDIYDEFGQAGEGGGRLVERSVAAGSN